MKTSVTRTIIALLAILAFLLSGSAPVYAGEPPFGNDGDNCHGANTETCRPDPQPSHGADCASHGNNPDGNDDHCAGPSPLPSASTGTPSPVPSVTPSPTASTQPSVSPTTTPSTVPSPTSSASIPVAPSSTPAKTMPPTDTAETTSVMPPLPVMLAGSYAALVLAFCIGGFLYLRRRP